MRTTFKNVTGEKITLNFYDFNNVQYPQPLDPDESVSREDFRTDSPYNPGVECKDARWAIEITTDPVPGEQLGVAYVNSWFPPPKKDDYLMLPATGYVFNGGKGGSKGVNIVVFAATVNNALPEKDAPKGGRHK